MQLSHLPHVLLGISYTVLALISQNSPEVSMRSLGYGFRLFPSLLGGESHFGFTFKQTNSKTAMFDRNRASFIATNLAIGYIKYIEHTSNLPEPILVLT
jgi:hypothetical protein